MLNKVALGIIMELYNEREQHVRNLFKSLLNPNIFRYQATNLLKT